MTSSTPDEEHVRVMVVPTAVVMSWGLVVIATKHHDNIKIIKINICTSVRKFCAYIVLALVTALHAGPC